MSRAVTQQSSRENFRKGRPSTSSSATHPSPKWGNHGRLLFFLYHSFGPVLVASLIEHLEHALTIADVKIFIIYYNPVHFGLFDLSTYFSRYSAQRYLFSDAEKRTAPFHNEFDSVVV